jgi:2,3-bisphosphoglycerate-dependent phosphoglycerate mutase
MPILAIVRHGQSQWNLENRFTGWIDVDLSPKGEEEAREAGKKLKDYKFDRAFTSSLKRAQRTLEIILKEIGQENIPIVKDQALNERMYGELQGMNKDECRTKFGEEQVKIWRRSFSIAPPGGESLLNTAERVLPYYHKNIEPLLRENNNIIIAAHGNSLRALVMTLENITEENIINTEIPTGHPKIYEFYENMELRDTRYL